MLRCLHTIVWLMVLKLATVHAEELALNIYKIIPNVRRK